MNMMDNAQGRQIPGENDAMLLLVATYLLYLYSVKYKSCHDIKSMSIVLEPCHLIQPNHGPWTE